jgi:SAM-dependent methyltransferase
MSHDPYGGLKEVVRYNRHQYATAAVVIAASAAVAGSKRAPGLIRLAAGLVGAGTAALTVGSLAATHLIYDRSKLRRWYWLDSLVGSIPQRWTNIHCGLDDATLILSERWGTPEAVLDIFDEEVMTEPSIRRARKLGFACVPAEPSDFKNLPSKTNSQDLVLAIFSLHELRSRADRQAAFAEIARTLNQNGRFVLVEHLRDEANIAAFGPGAMHFWSRAEWLSLAESAGLILVGEKKVTPFVRGLAFARLESCSP